MPLQTSLQIINHAPQILSGPSFLNYVNAQYRQCTQDFAPVWGRTLLPWASGTDVVQRDAWVLHIWNDLKDANDAGFYGYHENQGKDYTPVGHIFLAQCARTKTPWTAIASHEVLEMGSNPFVNQCVSRQNELWDLEVVDAVQGVFYAVNGVVLSDFVLPEYFIEGSDGPFDFQRKLTAPFSIHPTGYSSIRRIGKDGRISRRDIYGARVPLWPRRPHPFSRKHLRIARHG
jgi:hypothetical protein